VAKICTSCSLRCAHVADSAAGAPAFDWLRGLHAPWRLGLNRVKQLLHRDAEGARNLVEQRQRGIGLPRLDASHVGP